MGKILSSPLPRAPSAIKGRWLLFVSVLVCVMLLGPLVSLVLSAASMWVSPQSVEHLGAMLQTVLPGYMGNTLWLCLLVGAITAIMGTSAAVFVCIFDFWGRRMVQWALLLPLAMPAYVVAYAYTDFLQYSGFAQNWLRSALAVQGRVLPEIRNVMGAAFVLAFCLYPYVYLLVRTALSERAIHLMEAARLLGASLGTQLREVVIPLARPSIAAGVILALMETIADYGVVSYFSTQTLTAGIYKAWLVLDDRAAAAQLAIALLVVVLILIGLEHKAQSRMRFASSKDAPKGALSRNSRGDARIAVGGVAAFVLLGLSLLPTLLGFGIPVGILLFNAYEQLRSSEPLVPVSALLLWSLNSLQLSTLSALVAVVLAVLLVFTARIYRRSHLLRPVLTLAGLGYAVPGAVIVVGLLMPLTWLQVPPLTFILTATSAGVLWGYCTRFTGAAMQSLQSGYTRIPLSMDESSWLLGSSVTALFGRVHLPLLRRSILTALLLVFVDVMKELPVTLVLRPFNSDTLAVAVYNLARDERLAEAALPSIAIVLAGLVPVLWLSKEQGH